MSASVLLRASRLSRGISQAALAARARTSQPDVSSIESGKRIPTVDTLERLLQQTGHRLLAVPSIGPDAVDTANRIASALRGPGRDAALRAFIDYSDQLARTSGADRVVLAFVEPPATGSAAWDAALAAVADHWLSTGKLPKAKWIAHPNRFLPTPQTPHLGEYDIEPDPANVPPAFLRRNVLLERATLASV